VVVGDHDPDRAHGGGSRGRITVRQVPAAEVVMDSVPPHDSARCLIEASPSPSARVAVMPPPLSLISMLTASWQLRRTAQRLAPECRTTFVIASWAIR
jgi:hypothetical protein